MATASALETEIPEPIPKRSDIAKGIRTVYLNRVAHMGMMLDKMNRQNRRAERIEKFAATGDVKTLDAPDQENEEMGVNIGNEYHYHGVLPPDATPPAQPSTPAVPATTTPPQQTAEQIAIKVLAKLKQQRQAEKAANPPPSPAKQNKWLVPALIGTSLLTGGGLTGMIVNSFLQPPATQTVDTDTSTDVIFPK